MFGIDKVKRIGTLEEIAAVDRELDAMRKIPGYAKTIEFRRLCLKKARLRWPVDMSRKRSAAKQQQVLRRTEEQARRTVESLYKTIHKSNAGELVKLLLKIAKKDLIPRLQERICGPPCDACGRKESDPKAEQALLGLVQAVFKVEKSSEPPKKREAREVEVVEWPTEGIKT